MYHVSTFHTTSQLVKASKFDGYNVVIYKKMLKFSILSSILTVYRKVTMLKHETILNNYLLEINISENNILFGICCIVKLQEHKGKIKKHKYASLQAVPVCPIAICSSYLMPACFCEMP